MGPQLDPSTNGYSTLNGSLGYLLCNNSNTVGPQATNSGHPVTLLPGTVNFYVVRLDRGSFAVSSVPERISWVKREKGIPAQSRRRSRTEEVPH